MVQLKWLGDNIKGFDRLNERNLYLINCYLFILILYSPC